MTADINISYLLPAPLWAEVGDYMGDQECTLKLDPVLDESVKSERFKHKKKAEDDKNLRVFWDALRFNSSDEHYRKISLPSFFQKFSDCLDPEDAAFGSNQNPLPKNSQAVVDSIRKVVNNPIVQQNLFPAIIYITYHSPHEGAPSMLRKELNGLSNLKGLTLNRTVLANGLGTFATPLDLCELPKLEDLRIENSNLQDEDLLLSHRIWVRSCWSFGSEASWKTFSPSLTTFAGWKDLILHLPQDLCGLIGRFFNWLCTLC